MNKIQLKLLLFIKATFVAVILALFTYTLSTPRNHFSNRITEAADGVQVLHESIDLVKTETYSLDTKTPDEPIPPRDERAIRLETFLRVKGSYLADYTDLIVEQSDAYGVDYRLLVAISGVESGYCKVNFRPFNCWGYGTYAWNDPQHAITSYMASMYRGYFSRGARTPESIAQAYNPHPGEYTAKVYLHWNLIP